MASPSAASAVFPTSLPPGGTPGRWLAADGWTLRTMDWPAPENPKGSLLFIGGRADFIEKYAESYGVFRSWGLGVSTFDWRGQGGSGRLGRDPQHGHALDFDLWVDDLDAIVAQFVAANPGPHYAIGHSMGGHLLLRHLARGGSPLARAALLAPMLGIPAAPPGLRRLARIVTALGFGDRFAPLQRPYGGYQQRAGRMNLLTGCPDRFTEEHRWLAAEPSLSIGGVTWGWLAAADRSIDALRKRGVLEAIETPTLTLVGARERLIHARPAARLSHGRFEIIPGGRHELLRDAEGPRLETLSRLKAFLA